MDYVSKIQIGNGEEVDIKDSRLDDIYSWYDDEFTKNIVSTAAPPSIQTYGTSVRLRGDGVVGAPAPNDTYWLGIGSDGTIYSGTQLNGASTITWQSVPRNTPTTITFTALGKVWYFRRIGIVVYVDAPTDLTSAAAGMNLIGTLPADFRPGAPVYLHPGNNSTTDFRLIISTDGAVNFYSPVVVNGAINCGFSGYSYIVG